MTLSLDDVSALAGNRLGVHDVACPKCGPNCRTPSNRKRRVLRIWWEEAGFARFACARCGMTGFAREGDISPRLTRAPAPAHHAAPDDAERTANALDIWAETVPLAGTPGETYLASRGVLCRSEALRWHPACPFGKARRNGAMVALVRNIITDAPQAIHRTAIDAKGRKLSDIGSNGRLTLGPIRGGAIKLSADAEVTTALGIGEGIETTLSMRWLRGLGALPVWSLVSANQLAAFPVLPGIEELWIAVDHDESGTGQKAADKATARWAKARRVIRRIKPTRLGTDLNDLRAAHDNAA